MTQPSNRSTTDLWARFRFSVVGSLTTMVVAVALGFTWAMLGGGACYLLASLTAGALPRPGVP